MERIREEKNQLTKELDEQKLLNDELNERIDELEEQLGVEEEEQ